MPQQPLAQVPEDAEWNWQEAAACRDRDVSMFFHPANERGRTRRRRELAAKALCHGCAVRITCADYAIRAREPYGVWGGLTETEREMIYARIPVEEYPRARGEGARRAAAEVARAVAPEAFIA